MTIPNSLCLAQMKGGVGKTSIATNLAGLSAAAGLRTLLVDLDPQGNCADDLGYESDDGAETLAAITEGAAPLVHREVRERLDVIPGGPALGTPLLNAIVKRPELLNVMGANIEQMVRAAGDYELVVLDTPPGHPLVDDAVLRVVTTVVAPCKLDVSSVQATVDLAEHFAAVRAENPELQLAGIVLFNVRPNSTRLIARTRAKVSEHFGDDNLILKSIIRQADAASVHARDRGLLAHELDEISEAARTERFKQLRARASGDTGEDSYISNAGDLAGDYHDLAQEVFAHMSRQRKGVTV